MIELLTKKRASMIEVKMKTQMIEMKMKTQMRDCDMIHMNRNNSRKKTINKARKMTLKRMY
jgi:uncharacterized protein Veg